MFKKIDKDKIYSWCGAPWSACGKNGNIQTHKRKWLSNDTEREYCSVMGVYKDHIYVEVNDY